MPQEYGLNNKESDKEDTDMHTFLRNIPSAKAQANEPESEKLETKNPNDTEKHSAKAIENRDKILAENEVQSALGSKIEHTTMPEASKENTPIETPSKSQVTSSVSERPLCSNHTMSGNQDISIVSEESDGSINVPLFRGMPNIEQSAIGIVQTGKTGVERSPSQLKIRKVQSLQPQEPSSTPPPRAQTPFVQEIEKSVHHQGQPLLKSIQLTNQMRQPSLTNQTGPRQTPSSLDHSMSQGFTGAKVVGMQGIGGNGCQSTGVYPYPGNFPLSPGPRYMQSQPPSHAPSAGPYQQSVYPMNSQIQSLQFPGPPQSHQGHQNQSFYPPYQPIYVTQNFYGNMPGPMTQQSGYFQAPQSSHTNSSRSRTGAVGGQTPLVNPLAKSQGVPVPQQGVQESSQPVPLMPISLGQAEINKGLANGAQHLAKSTVSSKRQKRVKGLMEIVDPKTGMNISDQIYTDLHNRANQFTPQNWSREMITEFVAHVTKSTVDQSGSDLPENANQRVVDNGAEREPAIKTTDENVLNKLVPQNIDVLIEQIGALCIDSEEKLQGVVKLVFQKAIGEPMFMRMYALMCKKLSKIRISDPNSEADQDESNVTFGNLIANRCKMMLEKSIYKNTTAIEVKEFEQKNKLREQLTDEEKKSRTKSFSNIRFMGELVIQDMLQITIIYKCIDYLLTQIDDESLECLCMLLSTVGEKLESEGEKLDPYFEQIVDIVDRKVPGKISPRVRLMLLDLIDLRKNKWVRRKCSQPVRNQPRYVFDTSKPKNERKLEFTFGNLNDSFGDSNSQLSMENIHQQLLSLMSNEKENFLDNICSWISVNVNERASDPEFAKVLMTAILEVSIEPYKNTWKFKVDKFRSLQTLIPRYIDVNIKLSELQCLIAIQEYIHQLEDRQRVLLVVIEEQIFQSIISSDELHASETNRNVTPFPRKSAAMVALKSFFTSLQEVGDKSSHQM